MPGDHYEEYIKKEVEKKEESSGIYNETKKMLQSEERFVNFFKSYHPKSIESFIDYYAQFKAGWYSSADDFSRLRQGKNKHWWYLAVSSFIEIFYKKLFNVKCRWVAGEMDLPGIEASADFYHLMQHPSECNIIEPVSENELNCYIDYLKSGLIPEDEYEGGNASSAIGHYHPYKSTAIEEPVEETENDYISPWFRFYDRQFGTGSLLQLPLTREDIEQDYHDIWTEHIYSKTFSEEVLKTWSRLNRKQSLELRNNPQKRESFHQEQQCKYEEHKKKMPVYVHISTYDSKIMDELVPLLETSEVQKLYRASRRMKMKRNWNEMIESDIIYMKEVQEWIAVQPNDDYRKAIKEAYKDYSDKKVMEMLPVVFEEYSKAMKANKPFDWTTSEYESPSAPRDNEMKKRLLAARKWKGEPENFDFLKKENLAKYIS